MSIEDRDRLAAFRDALDRKMSGRGIPSHGQLVQVYDGGSIPTTVPKMFLARPAGVDVDETEGATPSISPDTDQTIPVLVLGPQVPVAGDNLLASVVGGRWVAGMQGGVIPELACSPCGIPTTSLTFSSLSGTTHTMTWNGPDNFWLFDFGGGVFFQLSCGVETGGFPSIFWQNFDESETMSFNAEDSTCHPLHLVFDSLLAGPTQYFVDYP